MSSTGSDRYAANCILPRQRITTVSNSDIIPDKLAIARAQHGMTLTEERYSAYTMKNHQVYGVRKESGTSSYGKESGVARCTVASRVAVMGRGVLPG